jgi:RimJ/RimL family protein N-acetyltransferase
MEVGRLVPYQSDYNETLGRNDQRYFDVYISTNVRLGFIGVFNSADVKNEVHVDVNNEFRGQGLAQKFIDRLMAELHLPFITLVILLTNEASLKMARKLPGVEENSTREFRALKGKTTFRYGKKP